MLGCNETDALKRTKVFASGGLLCDGTHDHWSKNAGMKNSVPEVGNPLITSIEVSDAIYARLRAKIQFVNY